MKSPLLILIVLIAAAGCVSVSPASDLANASKEMEAQVRFLSQRKLGGRKPGTHGSRLARQYIESRFKTCGLVPWGNAKGFAQAFGNASYGYGGENIVGLFPGSDPQLSQEIVIVSAHYDHLGKAPKGGFYPGAADNASGVAALLEVARQLTTENPRPKRSILFVAFDCEEMMLFGSFAFSCDQAVQQANIAAVINMDMLGRDFFDVVQHAVFVAGAERYPALREDICRFGAEAGIRILPLGTDLIGPRSDHVAFEPLGVPCLFFSCGTFSDYHQPTDTPDKLNYEDLERSAKVVLGAVREIATCPRLEPAVPSESGYAAELRTVCKAMSEINQNRARAGVKADDAGAFEKLAQEAEDLLSNGSYDRPSREKLIIDASGILAPYFLPSEIAGKAKSAEALNGSKELMRYLYAFYLRYGPQIMEGYRGLVAQLLKYHPGPVPGDAEILLPVL